jgi:regulator of sigma E protease
MILTILVGLIGLGLMVFIHELGHFVAAKLSGVTVETLSLGWGPRLAGFTRGGTTYQVSWFPVGGYCKMKGELVPGIAGGGAEAIARAEEGKSNGGAPSTPEARGAWEEPIHPKGSFLAASPLQRIMIAVFGPL